MNLKEQNIHREQKKKKLVEGTGEGIRVQELANNRKERDGRKR